MAADPFFFERENSTGTTCFENTSPCAAEVIPANGFPGVRKPLSVRVCCPCDEHASRSAKAANSAYPAIGIARSKRCRDHFVTQVRRGKSNISHRCTYRKTKLLKSLHSLLQKLPKDKRRTVLQQRMSQAQRLALEGWILKRRRSGGTLAQRGRAEKLARDQQVYRQAHCSAETAERPLVSKRALRACKRAESTVTVPVASPTVDRYLHALKIGGISYHRRKSGASNYHYYSAEVNICGIRVLTKTCADIRQAVVFNTALRALQRFVRGKLDGFEHRFIYAVSHILPLFRLTPEAMKMRIVLSFHALGDNVLRTMPYKVPDQLREGLQAWRRLQDSKGENLVMFENSPVELYRRWERLRDEYVAVMSERAGPGRLEKVRIAIGRADSAQKTHYEKLLERWNARRMGAEEKSSRLSAKTFAFSRVKRRKMKAGTNESGEPPTGIAENDIERAIEGILERWVLHQKNGEEETAIRSHPVFEDVR